MREGKKVRITKYRTELDQNKHNILVKERTFNYTCDNMCNAGTIAMMLNDCFGLNRMAEEYLYMVAFNTKCRVLGVFELSHGTVNASLITPREVFIRALLCGASGIVIAHNHPTGDTTPSEEDRKVCERIKSSGDMLGVPLLDSIIVGDNTYSFYENDFLK